MTGPDRDVTLVEHLTTTDAHAEWKRRLALAAEHPDEPAYRDAARAVDPGRTDPARVDVPDHLMVAAELEGER